MKRLVPFLPLLLILLSSLALVAHGPIAQLDHYHAFSDQATWLGLPHPADVLSNLGFALVGLWGICSLWPERHHPQITPGRLAYGLFLLALVLTAAGSSYYHLAPDNDRLLWDRLPIALACAGLLVGVWADTGLAKSKVAPVTIALALYAVASVFWWYVTELKGAGDLRPYLLIQVLPIVLVPLLQAIYRAPRLDRLWFGAALGLYVVAKAAELNDHLIHELTAMTISGHTLKHLLASAAAALLVYRLVQRTKT